MIQGRNSTLQYPLIFNIQLVIKYLPGWLKKVLKVISRNLLVAALTANISVLDLSVEHSKVEQNKDTLSQVLYAITSGNESNLPDLTIPFS